MSKKTWLDEFFSTLKYEKTKHKTKTYLIVMKVFLFCQHCYVNQHLYVVVVSSRGEFMLIL